MFFDTKKKLACQEVCGVITVYGTRYILCLTRNYWLDSAISLDPFIKMTALIRQMYYLTHKETISGVPSSSVA